MDDQSLATFCSVTGCSEHEAAHYLEATNGDVDRAMNLYFETGAGAAGGALPPLSPARDAGVGADMDEADAAAAAAALEDPIDLTGDEPGAWARVEAFWGVIT